MASMSGARGRRWLVATAALAAAVVPACTPHPVGPARTYSAYEGKAVTTAASALSHVQTVVLAAESGSQDEAFGPYLSVLVSGEEDGLSGLQGTFGSVQPPDGRADDLRGELDELLGRALSDVAAVRIAVRRGQLAELEETARPLADDAAALDRFVSEHES